VNVATWSHTLPLLTVDAAVVLCRYLRTSSEPFTLRLSSSVEGNQMVHLTNYCMQKYSDNIGKFEDGNTLSFDQLQQCVCGGSFCPCIGNLRCAVGTSMSTTPHAESIFASTA